MQPEFVSGSLLLESAWAFGLLIASTLIGWFIVLIIRFIKRRLDKQDKNAPIYQYLQLISKPILFLFIAEGLLLALSSISYLANWRTPIEKTAIAFLIVFFTYLLSLSIRPSLSWYLQRRKVRQSLTRLVQRITTIFMILKLGELLIKVRHIDCLKIEEIVELIQPLHMINGRSLAQ